MSKRFADHIMDELLIAADDWGRVPENAGNLRLLAELAANRDLRTAVFAFLLGLSAGSRNVAVMADAIALAQRLHGELALRREADDIAKQIEKIDRCARENGIRKKRTAAVEALKRAALAAYKKDQSRNAALTPALWASANCNAAPGGVFSVGADRLARLVRAGLHEEKRARVKSRPKSV